MLSTVNIHHGRPRATTASSQQSIAEEDPKSAPVVARPPAQRSHSYLSPVDPKPRNVNSLPINAESENEKEVRKRESTASHIPRIHLPGHRYRHSHDLRENGLQEKPPMRKHRHTNSDALPSLKTARSSSDLNSGAGGLLGANVMNESLLHPGLRGAAIPQLMRMASHRSTRSARVLTQDQITSDVSKLRGEYVSSGLRRRATSDPKSPSKDQFGASYQQPMSELDVLIYKSERARQLAATEVATDADVAKLSAQLAESNVELQSRLSSSTRTASEMMRRLDDTHDSLLRTASSLIDTISSFQNLTTQSSALISNFESSTEEIDRSIRSQLSKHQTSLFDERGSTLANLERRGKSVSERAEALSRRLDNCRIIVQNFEQRQLTKRRAWKGVAMGLLWGIFLILLGILLGFGIFGWRKYGHVVKSDLSDAFAGMLDDARGTDSTGRVVSGRVTVDERVRARVLDPNFSLNDTQLQQLNIPQDVRVLLGDIAQRHRGGYSGRSVKGEFGKGQDGTGECKVDEEDKRIRLLDEL